MVQRTGTRSGGCHLDPERVFRPAERLLSALRYRRSENHSTGNLLK